MRNPASGSHDGPGAPELPVEAGTLYPEDGGFFGRRAKDRRAKLLAGIDPILRKALAPGETIRYAALGTRYHLGEFMFAGNAARYHNMMALVLTDRRLLLIQVGARRRPGDIKHELPLAAIRGAGKGFLSGWSLRLADGTKVSFVGVPKADRKRLEALLPAATAAGPASTAPSLVHLCPACLRPVPGPVGTTLTCPQLDCRIPFRDPRKAARLSALVPGLGDLYLRHHLFGALEFLGSMMLLGVGAVFALQAAATPEPAAVGAALGILALFVVVPRLVDWRLTLHMARKGLVPLALAPAPGAQAKNLPSYPAWAPLLFLAGIGISAGMVALTAPDLRHDAAGREAAGLASSGRFEDAHARFEALEAAGGANDERRVRFALALMEAGDVQGADEVRARFGEARVDAGLADRWNAALAAEQEAIGDYQAGVQALLAGDEAAAWPALDKALAWFRKVKRPHLPASRGEVRAHLAMGLLAEPLRPEDVEAAGPWLDGLDGAPAAEVAILQAAVGSARGDAAGVTLALSAVELSAVAPSFQLLALEARGRLAVSAEARAEVGKAAGRIPRDALDEDELERLEALIRPEP